jgi:pimeloyl-ACP methyl ester carboxylesterase
LSVIQREFAESRDGLKIRYELRGAGEPVAMIMGFSGSMRGWGEDFLKPMECNFRLVLIDNRGVGESDKPDSSFTVADMAADVASVLGHAKIARAHVFGISMGGMIAQEFALANPARVRGLVLGCTTCGVSHGIQAPLESVSALIPEPGMSPLEQARRALTACLGRVSKSDGRAEQFIARAMAEFGNYPITPPHSYARQMGAIMSFDTWERLPQIAAPTLIIHGDDDNILPVGNARVLGERIKGARTQILPGAGHLFFWEEPAAVARAAAEHLSRAN